MPARINGRAPVAAPKAPKAPKAARANAAQPTAPKADAFAAGAAAGAPKGTPTTAVNGPFAKLASKGDFTGFVRTASGQDVYVSIKLAKNAATTQPMVLLDGIASRYERNGAFEKLVQAKGQTIVTIFLAGQGETLARDFEKNRGASVSNDIEQEDQARTVIEVLDELGVKQPAGVLGLSYGGAIAAQLEHDYPKRFDKVMLIAPYQTSEGKKSPMYGMMMNNPFNPFGPQMYRDAAKSALTKLFDYTPEVLKKYPGAFHDGLYRLTMGLEDFELKDVVAGMNDLHMLMVPGDTASPPDSAGEIFRGAKTGSFLVAPKSDDGKHDLIRGDGQLVATWVTDIMAGRTPAEAVSGLGREVDKQLGGAR